SPRARTRRTSAERETPERLVAFVSRIEALVVRPHAKRSFATVGLEEIAIPLLVMRGAARFAVHRSPRPVMNVPANRPGDPRVTLLAVEFGRRLALATPDNVRETALALLGAVRVSMTAASALRPSADLARLHPEPPAEGVVVVGIDVHAVRLV